MHNYDDIPNLPERYSKNVDCSVERSKNLGNMTRKELHKLCKANYFKIKGN